MEKLTVKEALAQGYTKCAFRNDEWTTMFEIAELNDVDFEEYTWWLGSKESKSHQIESDFLKDLLSDVIGTNESEDSGRDDDVIYNAVEGLDYSQFTKMINDKLKEFQYWNISEIKLIQ